MKVMPGILWSLVALIASHNWMYAQETTRYDSSRRELSMGAVLKTATAEGVGVLYKASVTPGMYFRTRMDVLFARTRVQSEYNYAELRPVLARIFYWRR